MYINRDSNTLNKQKIYSEIILLKDSMNDKRVVFDLPLNHIRITGNYLVGLLEGDGSFYLNKNDMTVRFSLVTTTIDRLLLEKIREFLLSRLDEHSCILGSSTGLININDKRKLKTNNKPISVLEIYQIDYICNIFIPYLDSLQFRTKKFLDYLDFKTIAFLIFQGKYLTDEGKSLIIKLGDTMNNSRLSTNSNPIILDEVTKSELNSLIKAKPLINVDSEGRAKIISEKRYIRSTYIIKATFLNNSVSYFTNGVSCAKALHVSNNTITQRLNDGKPVKNKDGLITAQNIKRIKAYSSPINT
uniref:LAGLIDADG endonuclease n=1 Tax=Orbilia oligospora TaxID=2813651 RepID=A0A6H2U2G7_ORBOL|nr:LAGLIDADG endonuclease [Orbilia oligospora]